MRPAELRVLSQAIEDFHDASLPADGELIARSEGLEDLAILEAFVAGAISTGEILATPEELAQLSEIADRSARRVRSSRLRDSLDALWCILAEP